MGAGEVCCIFLLKNPKWYNGYFMATAKWDTCFSLSMRFLMDTCHVYLKKSQLTLIGILDRNFCGEFSNGHGSRSPSISPQERWLPSRPKGSWYQEASLPLQWRCTGPWFLGLALGSHGERNKTPCAVGCSQVGVSSWPWRVRDVWGRCWGQLPGHSTLPLDNIRQEKSVSSLKQEGEKQNKK